MYNLNILTQDGSTEPLRLSSAVLSSSFSDMDLLYLFITILPGEFFFRAVVLAKSNTKPANRNVVYVCEI